MERDIKIAPSILSADFAAMGAAVRKLEECGADLIHCDVMDGSFVQRITFGSQMVEAIKKYTSLPLDVHLMCVQPENKLEDFVKAGADILTVHVEACGEKLPGVLKKIRDLGVRCCVSVSPDTPIESVLGSLEMVDMLLIMSVYPGLGGQKFLERVLPKAETARKFFDAHGLNTDIEIDGGINEENIGRVVSAGVNVIVAGNTIFKAPDMAKTIADLKKAGMSR